MGRLGLTVLGAGLAVVLAASVAPVRAHAATVRSTSAPIQHIIIVVQEARSFDNLFCNFPGSDSRCGQQTIGLEAQCVLSDTFEAFSRDLKNSKNFGRERASCPGYKHPAYAHVPQSETTPYWTMAQQYVLGDRMFSSTGNPTFEAHQYLIAAQASAARDEPFGTVPRDGCAYRAKVDQFTGGPQPACFTYETLASELDAAGLGWAYYHRQSMGRFDPWDAYGWIRGSAHSSEYRSDDVSPETRFLEDVSNGKLAAVTWVTPDTANSDASGSQSATGPAWVASVVNAVGESAFWDSSAVFVTWSGFGGWFDHVTPPSVDNEGLGFRVPLIIVSPFAKQNHISHVQYEHGSILKFAEDAFALPRLAASDSRANSPAADAFDFTQRPRQFVPIPTH